MEKDKKILCKICNEPILVKDFGMFKKGEKGEEFYHTNCLKNKQNRVWKLINSL